MKKNDTLPELLAPAGTLAAALAAYAAGADAVYCGLGRFNAREMGTNFSFDDLSRLAARAKTTGKRFYLTLNTLVKETEWEAFGETVAEAARLDPDAIILQDPGVARFLRRYYPRIELHASTQMGIHNSAGIEMARKMGISRVILERQVPLTELKPVIEDSPLEVEVFIHGALCCSLSGNCLFSSWMGGWSGNRGRCKQPCRRRFHGSEGGESKSGFFFSTQDLYTLDLLPELKALGVASLKIEGRLKQPDYVDRVVRAYRMMLDAPPEDMRRVLGEARLILSGSYGRRWSHGFATNEDMGTLIQYDSPGVSGQLVGSLMTSRPGGVKVRLSRTIHLGDRIRLQTASGEESPSFTLTAIRNGNSPVGSAGAGQEVFIPLDRDAPAEGKMYKVGGSLRGGTPDGTALPLYQIPRRFDLRISLNRAGIRVETHSGVWEVSEAFESAERHALNAEKIRSEFRKSRLEGITAGECRVDIDGELFIPASRLKALRRAFWDWFAERIPPQPVPEPPPWQEILNETAPSTEAPGAPVVMLSVTGQLPLPPGAVPVLELPDSGFNCDYEYQLPHFCSEESLAELTHRLEQALAAGCRRFRITSLYQLSLFDRLNPDGLSLSAAYPLPVSNRLAAAELAGFGISRVQGWLELEREALEALRDSSPLPLEIYRYGRPPLLATRADVPVEGSISDSRGGRFVVVGAEERGVGGMTYLFPEKVMAIPPLEGTADCFDYRAAEPDERDTTRFNFDRELV